jgi:hypothetical protein
LTLGKLEQSVGGSSTYRVGTADGVEYSQVTLSFFAGSSGSRVYGVIELDGGSDKHRTFDLETTPSGELLLQERPKLSVRAAEEPAAAPTGHGHGTHPFDYIRSNVKVAPHESSESNKRERREGPTSSAHTACGVFLDIDSAFYRQWGVGGTEAEKMQAAINQASSYVKGAAAIFQSSFGSSLVIEIAGAAVFTTSNLGTDSATSAGGYLSAYSIFLASGVTNQGVTARIRGTSLPAAHESCLNVAFTHRNFGNTVGMAYLASPDSDAVGGICSEYTPTNPPQVFNTGMVDSWGSRDLTIMSRGIAHEIGHAFGADHACCSGASIATGCSETDTCSNPSLMYYMLSYSSNGGVFSAGSRAEVYSVLQNKGGCLRVPNSNPAAPTPASTAAATASTAAATVSTAATTKAPITTKAPTTKTTKSTTAKTTKARKTRRNRKAKKAENAKAPKAQAARLPKAKALKAEGRKL